VNAMPYVSFHDFFPKVAEKETRTFRVLDGKALEYSLPPDEYGLLEMFCGEKGCDCRRVLFSVISRRQSKILAVIAYGWEERAFYARWMRSSTPEDIDLLKGPCLNLASEQSVLAPAILRMVELVLEDEMYVERLKRHYGMFKRRIEGRRGKT